MTTKTPIEHLVFAIEDIQSRMTTCDASVIREQYRHAYRLAFDHLTTARALLTALRDATKD